MNLLTFKKFIIFANWCYFVFELTLLHSSTLKTIDFTSKTASKSSTILCKSTSKININRHINQKKKFIRFDKNRDNKKNKKHEFTSFSKIKKQTRKFNNRKKNELIRFNRIIKIIIIKKCLRKLFRIKSFFNW